MREEVRLGRIRTEVVENSGPGDEAICILRFGNGEDGGMDLVSDSLSQTLPREVIRLFYLPQKSMPA